MGLKILEAQPSIIYGKPQDFGLYETKLNPATGCDKTSITTIIIFLLIRTACWVYFPERTQIPENSFFGFGHVIVQLRGGESI